MLARDFAAKSGQAVPDVDHDLLEQVVDLAAAAEKAIAEALDAGLVFGEQLVKEAFALGARHSREISCTSTNYYRRARTITTAA